LAWVNLALLVQVFIVLGLVVIHFGLDYLSDEGLVGNVLLGHAKRTCFL
jgi:hypothetical protein